ncbi:hypothetical protein LEMLEM_LOCUS19857 [Lemmus lemmus]
MKQRLNAVTQPHLSHKKVYHQMCAISCQQSLLHLFIV